MHRALYFSIRPFHAILLLFAQQKQPMLLKTDEVDVAFNVTETEANFITDIFS